MRSPNSSIDANDDETTVFARAVSWKECNA